MSANRQCSPCGKGCLACTDANTCTTCQTSYYLNSN